ncbi:MAG: tRNA-dihydrouridine synthase family protein [Desulfobacterales bacterium]|nr:tRNA-dihydrouridine synthase family protein [Desulfobacterales bacterium]
MNDTLAELLNQPLTIRGRRIDKRLFLAPLSNVGNEAFRRVVASFGGYGLLFSEMCGAKSALRDGVRAPNLFSYQEKELPRLVCQLFGSEPDEMASAAGRVEEKGFFGVDVNLGCSVRAVCRHNAGAALLKDPPLAGRIVAAMRAVVDCPLFVKYRTGWKDDPGFAVDMARRFEDAGADALTFHPRVAPDRRSRRPKWEYIGLVKEAVSIPVFGNGDVFDAEDCLKMLRTTGCDGVSLGRLAIATPWVFAQWTDGFRPGPNTHLDCVLKLADLLEANFEPIIALRRFRKFASYFSANFLYGHTFYSRLRAADSMADVKTELRRFLESSPEMKKRPNISLFH